jgi:hypothetical protein
MGRDSFAAGASASLNETIGKTMAFLNDNEDRPNRELRAFLHEKLADFGEYWYKRGVRRGHMESYKIFAATGELPTKLRYKARRVFFDGQERRISVRYKIKTVTSQARQ